MAWGAALAMPVARKAVTLSFCQTGRSPNTRMATFVSNILSPNRIVFSILVYIHDVIQVEAGRCHMAENTENLRQRRHAGWRLADAARRLLTLVTEDASRSYADLGRLLNLSAAAVHDRVKRLRRDGVIKATVAQLDGPRLGRPLLAFVHVDTTSWAVTRHLLALKDLPDVEEIHTVT